MSSAEVCSINPKARFTHTVALFQALGGGWWHRKDVELKSAPFVGVSP
jgi:hypothetical protein